MIKFRFKGQVISDEVGSFTFRAPHTGWFYVQNHYGQITVMNLPPGFWRGLRVWWCSR